MGREIVHQHHHLAPLFSVGNTTRPAEIGLKHRPIRRALNYYREAPMPHFLLMEEISVMFLAQLRGAFWRARSPFVAHPY